MSKTIKIADEDLPVGMVAGRYKTEIAELQRKLEIAIDGLERIKRATLDELAADLAAQTLANLAPHIKVPKPQGKFNPNDNPDKAALGIDLGASERHLEEIRKEKKS